MFLISFFHHIITNNFEQLKKLYRPPQYATANVFPNQPQWNSSVDNDFDLVNVNSGQAGQAPKVNNHQKNSERMAEDESEFL